MMNPHDILGVQRGASIEDITAAWRRKMSEAHPDRGGDAATAASLNAARDELLGDGFEAAQEKLRAAAVEAMVGHITKAISLNAPDIAEYLKQEHHAQQARGAILLDVTKIGRASLEKCRTRYVFKGKGEDLVAASIESQARYMDKQIAMLEEAQAVCVIMGQLIGDYASPKATASSVMKVSLEEFMFRGRGIKFDDPLI